MTKSLVEPSENWQIENIMGSPALKAGPVIRFHNGTGQNQLAAVFGLSRTDNDTSETMNERRWADAKLIVNAPKMYQLLDAARSFIFIDHETRVMNGESPSKHTQDLIAEIDACLEAARHYVED